MRKVTGYYHLTMWSYRSNIHRIKIVAAERSQAAEALIMFLTQRGYYGHTVESISRILRPATSVNKNNTVIVAVTDDDGKAS